MVNEECASTIGYYDEHQLYRLFTINENGDSSAKYIDKDNRIILTEEFLNGNPIRTSYIYDYLGLLRYIIQPEGEYIIRNEDAFSLCDTSFVKKFCFYYIYDERKRLVEKNIPGQDPIIMEYDLNNRLIYFEDGNLREQGLKRYFLYDDFNRVKEEGITDGGTVYPRIYTYYDNYDFNEDGIPDYSYQEDSEFPKNTPANENKGRITGKKVKIIGDKHDGCTDCVEHWLSSAIFYDKFGRIIQTQEHNAALGNDVLTCELDFTGKLLKTKQSHTSYLYGITVNHIMRKTYSYDHAGRLIEIKQQINDNTPEIICENQLNSLGQVIRKKLGLNSSNALQTIDYSYNIRGWLTHINDIYLSASGNGDLFGMRLLYEATDNGKPEKGDDPPPVTEFTPQFNGNISAIRWENYFIEGKKGYEFQYDDLNRLINANFIVCQADQWIPDDSYTESQYSYDKNGNIKTLRRNGLKADETYGLIDNLTYIYIGNELVVVNDSVEESSGYDFCDNGQTDAPPPEPPLDFREYFYDANGNMIADRNKEIVQIDYNELNLPSVIDMGNNNLIAYAYDALGNKVQVNYFEDGRLIKSITYANGFIYSGNTLDYILGDEGRILNINGNFVYEYSIKDHLGNVRVCFTDIDKDGLPEVIQENSYYPFGLEMKGLSFNNPPDAEKINKYQFNSKEFQDDFNLRWYDYGARFYDPQLGRWHVIDPAAESEPSWTPYRYGFDNPIRYWDVNGNFEMDPAQAKQYERLAHYLAYNIQGISGNHKIMNALMKYGQFSSKQINSDLRWGQGPKVVIKKFADNSMGEFVFGTNSNILYINQDYVELLEKLPAGKQRDGILFRLAMTILHEYVHYGDDQDGIDYDGSVADGEEGNAFEIEAYGMNITSVADAQKILEAWKKQQEQEKTKQEDENKKKAEGAIAVLNNFNNLEEGTYVWNGTAWVKQ
jgi:RHS repeat-associated protein